MLSRQKEDMRITELLAIWVAKIKINNQNSKFDINRASERLVLQLLNLVFDYELVDLNQESEQYPGIDLGDRTKTGIGIQVTSRSDQNKIKHTLTMFNKYNYIVTFPNGLKMFILSTDTINTNRKVQAPFNRFFSYKTDIITPSTLMQAISRLENDSKRKKIISILEQQLGQANFLENTLQNLIHNIPIVSEADLKMLGHLLAERTSRRIMKFISLEKESWQHGYKSHESQEIYLRKFQSLFKLEEDHKTKLTDMMKSIQDGSALKIIFDEYLELEKSQFNMLISAFYQGQYPLLISTGMSFQFLLRTLLDTLIDKHNENQALLSTYFNIDVPKIENEYKTINEIIYYGNKNDKQKKLYELLDRLNNSSSIYLFINNREKLDRSHPVMHMATILYGNKISAEEIVHFLEMTLETVSLDGKVFAGFSERQHIFFLTPLDQKAKKALSILQQRSYFGIYYFECD